MIKQLFVNSMIIIAALFMFSQHFVYKPLNHNISFRRKFLVGVMTGISGSILIIFSVPVADRIVLDFRYIPLIVASIYAGPLAAGIGAVIIALFRVFYSNVGYTSLIAGFFILSACLGCGIISKLKIGNRKKWLYMAVFTHINTFLALSTVTSDYYVVIKDFIPYTIGYVILMSLVYYYAVTISVTNSLIRNLKKENASDYLTGLNNVRNFDKLYNDALKDAQDNSENLSVVIIDIDHFKKVNDTYGHQAGDLILRQLGHILNKSCRNYDIISRNGGEEFSVLLINCERETALEITERIRKRVESSKFLLPDSKTINLTISAGIATYPDSARDNESLYKYADIALYEAKNSGRNKVCYYDSNSKLSCV